MESTSPLKSRSSLKLVTLNSGGSPKKVVSEKRESKKHLRTGVFTELKIETKTLDSKKGEEEEAMGLDPPAAQFKFQGELEELKEKDSEELESPYPRARHTQPRIILP